MLQARSAPAAAGETRGVSASRTVPRPWDCARNPARTCPRHEARASVGLQTPAQGHTRPRRGRAHVTHGVLPPCSLTLHRQRAFRTVEKVEKPLKSPKKSRQNTTNPPSEWQVYGVLSLFRHANSGEGGVRRCHRWLMHRLFALVGAACIDICLPPKDQFLDQLAHGTSRNGLPGDLKAQSSAQRPRWAITEIILSRHAGRRFQRRSGRRWRPSSGVKVDGRRLLR